MTYEDLLKEAEKQGLDVKEKSLRAHKGRIKGNKIAIKKDIANTEKKCALVEELGHYFRNMGDILDQSDVRNRKQERLARAWGYEELVSIDKLIEASKNGIRNRFELAEYLHVTEEYIEDVLKYYNEKYGLYFRYKNYIVCFNPLVIYENFF